jgi:hypothetical protein
MRRVREIRKGEIMKIDMEKATPQNPAKKTARPFCVETGGRRMFSLAQTPTYFGQSGKNQDLEAEVAKLRAENSAMRSALDVICRTLDTVRRAQS